jgi:hypothetical protein
MACSVRGIFQLALNHSLVVGYHARVHPGGIIARFLYPHGSIAFAWLATDGGHYITGHVNRNELVILVPLILLAGFICGQTGGDPPVASISGPDSRNLDAFALGIGPEPDGAVA